MDSRDNHKKNSEIVFFSSQGVIDSVRSCYSVPTWHNHVRSTRTAIGMLLADVCKNAGNLFTLSLRTSAKLLMLIFTALAFVICYCALTPIMAISKNDLA